ncbi:hypothetical protein GCM10010123_32620 [Pilimelia anulata]|uniref:HTH marR-type domain-containing protein n=1 Tax=Pilimelia anulata TaxID=53371 RepID=A0A8J3FB34_9ACTN|nr:MarR family transcriptional regulator [Pilimelia anulata]GGK00188.1 hypothetical protein GCM10010123_32620 [Pilimelia anulata]
MTDVNRAYSDHAMLLLGHALQALSRDYADRLAQAPPGRLPDDLRGLRSSQIRLLSLTPPDGLRVTDLARRVGMTKQALGEFATALERLGLLESAADPTDRRARILRPTPRGRTVVAAAAALIAEVEADWRDRVGAAAWDAMRATLERVASLGGGVR